MGSDGLLPSLPMSEYPLSSNTIIRLLRNSTGDICRPFSIINDATGNIIIATRNIEDNTVTIAVYSYAQNTATNLDIRILVDTTTYPCHSINDIRRRIVEKLENGSQQNNYLLSPSGYYAILTHRSIGWGPRMGYGLSTLIANYKVYQYVRKHIRKHLIFPLRYITETTHNVETTDKNTKLIRYFALRIAMFLSWVTGDTTHINTILTEDDKNLLLEHIEDLLQKLKNVFSYLYVSEIPP